MTKPTSTREEHERIIPYSGHNSSPIRSQEDWNDSMLPRGAADPDYIGYPGQPDEVSDKPLEMLPFMQAIGGDSEPKQSEPIYEEAADTE